MAEKQRKRRKSVKEIKLKPWQVWASAAAVLAGIALLFVALRPAPMPHYAGIAALPPPPAHPKAAAKNGADPLAPLIKDAQREPLTPEPPKPAPIAPPAVAPAAVAGEKPQPAAIGAEARSPGTEQPEQLALAPPPVSRPAPVSPGPEPSHAVMPIHRHAGPPMIAIVLDDVGVDRRRSEVALKLPGPLTISFMTYAEDLPAEAAEAASHGDQAMLHVPMEPVARHMDPGPNALLVGLDPDEIRRRLEWGLSRLPQAQGINNHMGSRFTAWKPGMDVVISVLKERGLYFLDSRTTPHSVGGSTALAMGVPTVSRDVFLDDVMTESAVDRQLSRTEAIARRTGEAIAIGHPHDATIAALRQWLPTLAAKGFKLVTVKTLIDLGTGGAPPPAVSEASYSPEDAD